MRNCIFTPDCYSYLYGKERTAVGRAAHLRRGDARRRAVGRGAATGVEPADGRPPHRRARGGARRRPVRPLAARPDADRGGARPCAACRGDDSGGERRPARRRQRRGARSRRGAADGEPSSSASRRCRRSWPASPPTHPAIAIELALSNLNQDLARGEADLAVRMARPTQGGLVARRIGRTPIGLYAHRDYLARCGTPQSLAELADHCVIGFDRDDSSFRSVGAGGPFAREGVPLPLRRRSGADRRPAGRRRHRRLSGRRSPAGRRSSSRCCPAWCASASKCGWSCTRI